MAKKLSKAAQKFNADNRKAARETARAIEDRRKGHKKPPVRRK